MSTINIREPDTLRVIVEGDRACFTRPEMKVERVSYEVPTPGALEGMLKSIYWKPAMRYVIDKIIVFNPITFANIRRNEVLKKVKITDVKNCMKAAREGKPMPQNYDPTIYVESDTIHQRATMFLTNVRYGIEFHIERTGLRCEREKNVEPDKHTRGFLRRIEKGRCFRTPCLGVREFPVSKIELVQHFDENEICAANRGRNVDLGYMLYKVAFEDNGIPINEDWDNPTFSDKANTVYYRAIMRKGIIDVAEGRKELSC